MVRPSAKAHRDTPKHAAHEQPRGITSSGGVLYSVEGANAATCIVSVPTAAALRSSAVRWRPSCLSPSTEFSGECLRRGARHLYGFSMVGEDMPWLKPLRMYDMAGEDLIEIDGKS